MFWKKKLSLRTHLYVNNSPEKIILPKYNYSIPGCSVICVKKAFMYFYGDFLLEGIHFAWNPRYNVTSENLKLTL